MACSVGNDLNMEALELLYKPFKVDINHFEQTIGDGIRYESSRFHLLFQLQGNISFLALSQNCVNKISLLLKSTVYLTTHSHSSFCSLDNCKFCLFLVGTSLN